MAQKIRDVAVKTGTYTDAQGQQKGRWQNVGALIKGNDGGEFVILQRWFNPAGVANPDGRESVILSCFRPDQGGQQPQQQPAQQPQQAPAQQQPSRCFQQPQGGPDDYSDIAF